MRVIWKVNSKNLRKLLVKLFSSYNSFFGDNIGEYVDGYKINYQLPNCFLLEGQRTYRLEIDIWHKDSLLIDELADEIESMFNYASKQEVEWATFILENRVNEDEKNIFRRTLIYEVRTY